MPRRRREKSSSSNAASNNPSKDSWPYLFWSLILRNVIAAIMLITITIKTVEMLACEHTHVLSMQKHEGCELWHWTPIAYITSGWLIAVLSIISSVLGLIGVVNDRNL